MAEGNGWNRYEERVLRAIESMEGQMISIHSTLAEVVGVVRKVDDHESRLREQEALRTGPRLDDIEDNQTWFGRSLIAMFITLIAGGAWAALKVL